MFKATKSLFTLVLALVLTFGIAGCTTEGEDNDNDTSGTTEEITLKFFSNLPDRTSGQGLLEQTLIDKYMEENENVTIEVEALQDEPYKQKFQSYVAGNDLPDIFMVWGQPAFFQAVMENGYAAELDQSDYDDYGFFGGSTSDFSYEGKLYGLPRNQDVTVVYYNKAIFEEYDVEVPTTYEELLSAVEVFKDTEVAPMSINGKDKWILNLFFQDLVVKVSGDQDTIYNAIDQETTFSTDEDIRQAAVLYKELVDAGLFQSSYLSADYGAAINLFLQEKAAMFYMGAWEVGMASNADNSESFKENVEVMAFPTVPEGKGNTTDLLAWNGGGYAVSENSEQKEEAIKLLNFMMDPDNWAKTGWETSTVVPGQDYSDYLSGDENQLQLGVTDILAEAASMSGTPWNDYAPGDWKSVCETAMQEYSAGIINIDEFLAKLDEALQE